MQLTPILMIVTDFLSAVVMSEIAQIVSLYGGGFLALKWKVEVVCFNLALKLTLYTYKTKTKKKQSQYSVCYLQGQVKMASITGQF